MQPAVLDPDLHALRTQVANQAASLAETVTDGFDGFTMGAGGYGVQLTTPDGPSTAGGVQARQSLCLVPRRRGYAVIVAGTVDPVTSCAELRTFEHVAILHELRFGQAVAIDAEEYAGFLAKASVVMNLARVRAAYIPPPEDLIEQRNRLSRRRATRRSAAMLVGCLLVMVTAAVVAFLVALSMR